MLIRKNRPDFDIFIIIKNYFFFFLISLSKDLAVIKFYQILLFLKILVYEF